MMSDQPHACQLAADATTIIVPVCVQRTVCYEFDTSATRVDLAIPYLVIVDGKVAAQSKPRKLSASNRRISQVVNVGSKVALYLNSDVHPNHRLNPVYEVVVGNSDVLVHITEVTGQTADIQAVVKPANVSTTARPGATPIDHYTAKLSGDIWMTISHRYSEAEASALLPFDTAPAVRKAVCSIYRGLSAGKLDIPLQLEGEMLRVSFINQNNPQANISHCSLLTDVLPRTHPWAYAALFTVARNANLSELHITSCWRPSFGSIAHRAGLGLDVDLIASANKRIEINRVGLKDNAPSKNTNITDQEKSLLRSCDDSKLFASRNRTDNDAKKTAEINCAMWQAEVEKNQPKLMHSLREDLRAQSVVKQIFDPWYIELNTKDPKTITANEQQNSNEKIHKDHLHITIKEPKIYE